MKLAVELAEQMSTSTHHFYLDLNAYQVFNTRQEIVLYPEVVSNLSKMRCENILHHRKPFVLAKLDPQPTGEQLQRDLVNVAAIIPVLYMRQVGRGDTIRPPTVVRPQQVLVAWGSQERREQFLNEGERTLISHICHSSEGKNRGLESLLQWNPLPWKSSSSAA